MTEQRQDDSVTHISVMEKRVGWLKKRLDNTDKNTSPGMRGWMKRELAAINWALSKLKV